MSKKILAIQELRGVAVIYVVLFHVGNIFDLKLFSYGGSGVSVFFMISGFIISLIHKRDKGLSAAVLFIKKRIARIYPPYLLLLPLMIVLFLISGKGADYHRDILNILRNFFLIHNPSQSIHPYAWSLVYEIYYYVTFCLLAMVFRMSIPVYAAFLAIPCIIGSFYLTSIDSVVVKDSIVLAFSNLYFVCGALMGYYFEKLDITLGKLHAALALIAFLGIPFLTGNSIVVLISTIVLFLAYSKSDFSLPFMQKIGDASYSIYLIHAFVLSILKNVSDNRSLPMFFVFFATSVIAGLLYHIAVEKPLIPIFYNLLNVRRKQSVSA